jgi:hypothetical protein
VKRLLALLLAAGFVSLASAQQPLVPLASIKTVEKSCYQHLIRLGVDSSIDVLGEPRGIYLPGYGMVFTAEANLISVIVGPFRPRLTPEEVERLHRRKLVRLAALRQEMRQMMLEAARELAAVPVDDRIVFSVTLFNFWWEKTDGLPSQIFMETTRKQLLQLKPNAADEAIAAQVRVQEY